MKNNIIYLLLFLFLISFQAKGQNPEIEIQPSSKTVCEGDIVELKLLASGVGNLLYQWQKNGVDISGANLSSIIFNPVALADTGKYTCVITDDNGTTVSDTALLRVINSQPVLITQPNSDSIICENTNINIDISASGEMLNYHWYKDGNSLSNAYANSYSITNANANDAGYYYCEVSNVCDTIFSDSSLLAIDLIPEFDIQPQGATICENDSFSLSVSMSGTNLSYQWQINETDINGSNNDSIIFNPVQENHEGSYKCFVTNACGTYSSYAAEIEIKLLPTINSYPLDENICLGDTVNYIVSAHSIETVTYQWLHNGIPITDSTENTLSINGLQESDGGAYSCIVTNSCGNDTTQEGILSVLMPPQIITQPIEKEACIGESDTIGVKAVGAMPINYQWEKDDIDITTGTSTNYIVDPVQIGDEGFYFCKIENQCGSINTDTVFFNVNNLANITFTSSDIEECEGNSTQMIVVSEGTTPFTYQWHHEDTLYQETSNNSLQIDPINPENDGVYYCVVTNLCNSDTSDNINLQVNLKPTFVVQPEEQATCEGDSASFIVQAEGFGTPTYTWLKNGNIIGSENDSIISIIDANTNDEAYYSCSSSNNCGTTISDSVFLTVNRIPELENLQATNTACYGDSLIFNVSITNTNADFQWKFNNEIIGSNNDTLFLNDVDTNFNGNYICYLSNNCGIDSTETNILTVYELPEPSLGDDIDLCLGDTAFLSPGDYFQYKWNDSLSNSPTLATDTSGVFWVRVTDNNACQAYDTVSVTVREFVTVDFNTDSMDVCGGVTLSAPEGADFYNWNDSLFLTREITVDTSGTYYVTASDIYGCSDSDTINVEISPIPGVNLGQDIDATLQDTIVLEVPEGFVSYEWSTGSQGRIIVIECGDKDPGLYSYWVKVENEYGCYNSDTISISITVGIEDVISENDINVYPNPNSGSFFIDSYIHLPGETNISLFDISGKTVYTKEINNLSRKQQIDVSNLSKGLYFLQIQNTKGKLVKKIQIQ